MMTLRIAKKGELHVGLGIPKPIGIEIHNWAEEQNWPEGTELEPIEEYHVTMLYAPEGHSHKDDPWMEHESHAVSIKGIKAFPSHERGDKDAIVLTIDSESARLHHKELARNAEEAGIEISPYSHGDFKPHITIAYGALPKGLKAPKLTFETEQSAVSPPREESEGMTEKKSWHIGQARAPYEAELLKLADSWNPKDQWPNALRERGSEPTDVDCTCKDGHKLDCPVHGMHPTLPTYDDTLEFPDPSSPVGYDYHTDAPRTWMRAETKMAHSLGWKQDDQAFREMNDEGIAPEKVEHGWGKGVIDPDTRQVHTWPTSGQDGWPTHVDYVQKHGIRIPRPGGDFFEIKPHGAVQTYNTPSTNAPEIYEADPHLFPEENNFHIPWSFQTKIAGHQLAWLPGSNVPGKGLVTPSGDVHTWPVDKHGTPQHADYMDAHAPYQLGEGTAHFFQIRPRGGLDTKGSHIPANVIHHVLQTVPSLRAGERTDWHFAKMTNPQQDRFRTSLESEYGPEHTPVLHTFSDGWTVRHLPTWNELGREGDMMNHCWGGMGSGEGAEPVEDNQGHMTLSLRDQKNWPHASFSFDPSDRTPYGIGVHGGEMVEDDEENPHVQRIYDFARQYQQPRTAADQWDTREYPDARMMPPTTMQEPVQGNPHPEKEGCTCEEGHKLDCPVHGLNPTEEGFDHSWSIPQGHPVGYPQDQPRSYMKAEGAARPDRKVLEEEGYSPYEIGVLESLRENPKQWKRGTRGKSVVTPEGVNYEWSTEPVEDGVPEFMGGPHHSAVAWYMGLDFGKDSMIGVHGTGLLTGDIHPNGVYEPMQNSHPSTAYVDRPLLQQRPKGEWSFQRGQEPEGGSRIDLGLRADNEEGANYYVPRVGSANDRGEQHDSKTHDQADEPSTTQSTNGRRASDQQKSIGIDHWHIIAAADPRWLSQWIEKHGPYAYHGSDEDYDESIAHQGLLPWNHLDDYKPGASEVGIGQPRPNHVYMTTTPPDPYDYSRIYKVDLRKLDPHNLNPDEDWYADAAGAPLIDSYSGQSAEDLGLGDDSAHTHQSMEWGKLAHQGPIPPEAISIHESPREESWSGWTGLPRAEGAIEDRPSIEVRHVEPGGMLGTHNMTEEEWDANGGRASADQPKAFVYVPQHRRIYVSNPGWYHDELEDRVFGTTGRQSPPPFIRGRIYPDGGVHVYDRGSRATEEDILGVLGGQEWNPDRWDFQAATVDEDEHGDNLEGENVPVPTPPGEIRKKRKELEDEELVRESPLLHSAAWQILPPVSTSPPSRLGT